MSKTTLKKHLLSLNKEQLIEQILTLYDTSKPIKEYLEYYLNPNEKEQFEKYKDLIVNEFYPKGKHTNPKMRFAVAKRAMADFRRLTPAVELLADLMITLPETACKFTYNYGDMWEQFYTSTATNFKLALKFLEKHKLLNQFKHRCENCVKFSESCGYGFSDEIGDLFDQYYNE